VNIAALYEVRKSEGKYLNTNYNYGKSKGLREVARYPETYISVFRANIFILNSTAIMNLSRRTFSLFHNDEFVVELEV
jgi:hypothetical protein